MDDLKRLVLFIARHTHTHHLLAMQSILTAFVGNAKHIDGICWQCEAYCQHSDERSEIGTMSEAKSEPHPTSHTQHPTPIPISLRSSG
ncbi:MAG: hypothetical protein GX102_15900 [Porphyromonadaceae bacterium]|nr:hypothetical protein [Porphyromonadaceae bacterium]